MRDGHRDHPDKSDGQHRHLERGPPDRSGAPEPRPGRHRSLSTCTGPSADPQRYPRLHRRGGSVEVRQFLARSSLRSMWVVGDSANCSRAAASPGAAAGRWSTGPALPTTGCGPVGGPLRPDHRPLPGAADGSPVAPCGWSPLADHRLGPSAVLAAGSPAMGPYPPAAPDAAGRHPRNLARLRIHPACCEGLGPAGLAGPESGSCSATALSRRIRAAGHGARFAHGDGLLESRRRDIQDSCRSQWGIHIVGSLGQTGISVFVLPFTGRPRNPTHPYPGVYCTTALRVGPDALRVRRSCPACWV